MSPKYAMGIKIQVYTGQDKVVSWHCKGPYYVCSIFFSDFRFQLTVMTKLANTTT